RTCSVHDRAKYYQQRYRRRLAVKTYAHNRPVEDQSHDIFRRQSRAFQASKSVLILRQARFTVSLLTPPRRKTDASARPTRRVLVAERWLPARRASTSFVRRQYAGSVLLFHSLLVPSPRSSRARGTAIVTCQTCPSARVRVARGDGRDAPRGHHSFIAK